MINILKCYVEGKIKNIGDENYIKKLKDLIELSEISNLIFKSEMMDFLEGIENLQNDMLKTDPIDTLDLISIQMSNFMDVVLQTINRINKLDKKLKFIRRKSETNLETNSSQYVTSLEFLQIFPIYDPVKINDLIYSNKEEIIDICISDYLGQRMVNKSALITYILECEEDFCAINSDKNLTLL
jgi:hypothetical protein